MTGQNSPTARDEDNQRLIITSYVMTQRDSASVASIRGAVFLIARAGGGAGSDTVAAIIAYLAELQRLRVTMLDFSLEGDEGPAWARNGIEYECERLEFSSELAANLINAIDENRDGVVIINSPPNTLADIVDIEDEFRPIIDLLKRPYVLIWIDRPYDERIDRISGYRKAGGTARCVVAVRQLEQARGQTIKINVQMPAGSFSPITIPLLPSYIAKAFYQDRMGLVEAVTCGSLGHQLSFLAGVKKFAKELGVAL